MISRDGLFTIAVTGAVSALDSYVHLRCCASSFHHFLHSRSICWARHNVTHFRDTSGLLAQLSQRNLIFRSKKNNGKLWYDEGGRVQAVQTVKPMAWPTLSVINTCNSDRGNYTPLCSCKWSRRVFTIIIAVLLFRLLQYLHSSKTWAASPLALLLAPILRSTTY